jgi:EAL domain-containing protein (putative c-di-GMP-specific phosphodiesterase class I)/ActR/RegA family two-component response regulator
MANANRILVIDDDEVVCGIVSALAKTMGFECVSTGDAAAFAELATPDTGLILLDLMMPGMDGIEVLRQLGERQARARILLMSGVDRRVLETAEKLAQSLGLHVVGHLHKPVPLSKLRGVLSSMVNDDLPKPAEEPQPQPPPDDDLRRALERGEIVNYYQPQISVATGMVTGLESLARWRHPELGMIPPGSFIERVEALGLIDALFWRTAELALADVRQFNTGVSAPLRISLNVSMLSLHDLRLPEQFVELAGQYGIAPSGIAIEVTESGLSTQVSHTLDVLTRLRMKGFQLSIDDFGAGYAMMQQLQIVPATELKIDRSIVDRMHMNPSERIMAEKVIEMGHALDMEVMAEGVAVREQFDLLREMGCDGAQGFMISRPLPPGTVPGWLAEFAARPVR